MANIAATTCICGHLLTEHEDLTGECNEPTNRCQCAIAIELCAACIHSSEEHLETGRCKRTVFKTRQPCGCSNYPAVPTEEEGS